MNKIFLLVLIITSLFPVSAFGNSDVKAGFIRDGNLWILQNNEEKQITTSGKVFSKPQWSPDGRRLLYQQSAPSQFPDKEEQSEVWVYDLETQEMKKIFYDGYTPAWAPHKNVIAFNQSGTLNISDLKQFYNIATGVHSYTWLPDGSGFLLSTSGVLRPDGWTSAILFTKKVQDDYKNIVLFGGVDKFFALPREIGLKNNKIIAVFASDFQYSPTTKWISFIVSPTASWSMDSNMLCVISKDGKDFEVLDEVVFEVGNPKWAPSSDTIAFIAGGGRIVFGFKNKEMKVREMPVSGTFTPANYADLDFDWISDQSIVTSRVEEKEWSNNFSEHPLPSLYSVNIDSKKQIKITTPLRDWVIISRSM